MSDFLEHVIRETGQTHPWHRAEQQDEMLDYLRWLLVQAIHTGQTVAMPPLVWHVAARATSDRMEAVLWHGMADGPPHLVLHVSAGDPPRCETTREGYGSARTLPRPSWMPASWSGAWRGRGWKADHNPIKPEQPRLLRLDP